MKITKYVLIGFLAISLASCGNEANVNSSNKDSNVAVENEAQNQDVSEITDGQAESNDEQASESVSEDSSGQDNDTITITDKHGEVTVPKNPKRVVALDSRTFEVLEKFGVDLVAAPKDVMPADSSYVADEKVQNIGNHREPNLEILAAADPDLVIIGQRFANYYDDIKALLPNASIIDIDMDVSEETESPGNNLLEGYIDSTKILGEIFNKNDEAEELIADLEESLDKAKNAYNGESVMGVIVSGGEIGYSAPKYGRVWGPIFELLDLKPALEVENDSSDHMGDDISVEAIAQSNPAYLLVLDRDAAVSSEEGAKPARDVIENSEALKDLDVIKNDKIYYAPNDTYTNESIITFTEILNGLAETFKN